jgi:ammonia channel protein AmtB
MGNLWEYNKHALEILYCTCTNKFIYVHSRVFFQILFIIATSYIKLGAVIERDVKNSLSAKLK